MLLPGSSHAASVIMDAVAWICRVLATGLWPEADYDGTPWPEHSWRRMMAGKPLFAGARGVLSEVGGDLDEWAKICWSPGLSGQFWLCEMLQKETGLVKLMMMMMMIDG